MIVSPAIVIATHRNSRRSLAARNDLPQPTFSQQSLGTLAWNCLEMAPHPSRAAHLRRVDVHAHREPPSFRLLPGLTEQESREFAELDASDPLDADGFVTWGFEGEPLDAREARWLALYRKYRNAVGGAPCRQILSDPAVAS
jgi:hypothetical protein